jgi:hypothetical protein
MEKKEEILKDVDKFGAIMLRGFDIKSSNEVLAVLRMLGLKNQKYQESSPRRKIIVGMQ